MRNLILENNIYNKTKIEINEIYNDDNNINNNSGNNIELYRENVNKNNGDILMNYFPVNEELFNNQNITKNFNIEYKENWNEVILSWKPYLTEINNIKDILIKYSIYILPFESKINSMCEIWNIPPNYTIVNQNNLILDIPKGKYKVNIIASVINDQFPITTFYEFLDLNVSKKISKSVIIIIISIMIIISIVIIGVFLYNKNKRKNYIGRISNVFPSANYNRLISMTENVGDEDEIEENLDEMDEEEEVEIKEKNK